MNSERLGAITFFGILIPGSYLAATIVVTIAGLLNMCGLDGYDLLSGIIRDNAVVVGTTFLFISYLFGVLVRLFAPSYVDKLSTWYLVKLRRRDDDWVTAVFPYAASLTSRLARDGMSKVPQLMARLNPSYAAANNTSFFNYCKWFVYASDAALSRQIQDSEAMVRFLSGTTLVLLLAVPVSFIQLGIFALEGVALYSIVYGGFLAMAVLGLCLILERFKYQRRREVIMVWSSVYLIQNRSEAGSRDDLMKSVFFLSNTQP